jgi:hypothetical protein
MPKESETLNWQALNENNCQPSLLYLVKSFFKIKGEIKIVQNKHKLKESMINAGFSFAEEY